MFARFVFFIVLSIGLSVLSYFEIKKTEGCLKAGLEMSFKQRQWDLVKQTSADPDFDNFIKDKMDLLQLPDQIQSLKGESQKCPDYSALILNNFPPLTKEKEQLSERYEADVQNWGVVVKEKKSLFDFQLTNYQKDLSKLCAIVHQRTVYETLDKQVHEKCRTPASGKQSGCKKTEAELDQNIQSLNALVNENFGVIKDKWALLQHHVETALSECLKAQ